MSRKCEASAITDFKIGAQISELRITQGLSRLQLASKIGVTHQQLQKYEKGVNRISAGRLYEITKILNVTVGSLFENLENAAEINMSQHKRLCMEVSRNFWKIKSPENQKAASDLLKTLALNS